MTAKIQPRLVISSPRRKRSRVSDPRRTSNNLLVEVLDDRDTLQLGVVLLSFTRGSTTGWEVLPYGRKRGGQVLFKGKRGLRHREWFAKMIKYSLKFKFTQLDV